MSKINVYDILKGLPTGYPLYSDLYGSVVFIRVSSGTKMLIDVVKEDDYILCKNLTITYDEYGVELNGKSRLYPSINNFDWSSNSLIYIKNYSPIMCSNDGICWVFQKYKLGNPDNWRYIVEWNRFNPIGDLRNNIYLSII